MRVLDRVAAASDETTVLLAIFFFPRRLDVMTPHCCRRDPPCFQGPGRFLSVRYHENERAPELTIALSPAETPSSLLPSVRFGRPVPAAVSLLLVNVLLTLAEVVNSTYRRANALSRRNLFMKSTASVFTPASSSFRRQDGNSSNR